MTACSTRWPPRSDRPDPRLPGARGVNRDAQRDRGPGRAQGPPPAASTDTGAQHEEGRRHGEPKRTRLIFLGFPDQAPAQAVVDVIMAGRESKAIVVEDMVLIHKEIGGKVTVEGMKSADPGAGGGAVAGGALGAVLAVISGPIGIGAVVGGAAIGVVTAAVKDTRGGGPLTPR